MELSTFKNTINAFATSTANLANATAERVKGNWNNLSTTGKVATVATSILLTGIAIFSQFFTAAALLSTATTLAIGTSHLIAHIAGAALGALGLTIPAYLLLKKEQAKPAVVKEEVVKEEVVKEVVAEAQTPQETVKPSRLVGLKNTSIQFVKNHPRLVIAGSVLAIGVLSAGLMGAQRRNAIGICAKNAAIAISQTKLGAPVTRLGSTLATKGKGAANVVLASANTLGTKGKDAVTAVRSRLRPQSKLLDTVKK